MAHTSSVKPDSSFFSWQNFFIIICFPECLPLASPIGASGGYGKASGKATGKCFSETIGITTFLYDTFFPRMLWQNSTMTSYKLVERVFSPKLQFL